MLLNTNLLKFCNHIIKPTYILLVLYLCVQLPLWVQLSWGTTIAWVQLSLGTTVTWVQLSQVRQSLGTTVCGYKDCG